MTRLTAVIGDPVHHSLSPSIVNAAFSQLGLEWTMLTLQVPQAELDKALFLIRELDMGGMSVTMPHKKAVIKKLDELDKSARALDAVNCIVPQDGKLVGYNTDGSGFVWSLKRENIDLKDANVLIFGAGGAARAVGMACIAEGAARVAITARSKAGEAARMLGAPATETENPCLADFQILINATPLGMEHLKGQSPMAGSDLNETHTVVDLIYKPAETEFLRCAKKSGAKTLGGLGMLTGQASQAVKLWTGEEPDTENMHKAAVAKSNL